MEIGCFAPAQWVVSFSVSVSAALHTLKSGSHDTSGPAGGRNAATAGSATNIAILTKLSLFIFSIPS
jgi:hypothetical protein